VHHVRLIVDTFGTNPIGAPHPWGTPWLCLVDTLRVLCIIGFVAIAVRLSFGVTKRWVNERWRKVSWLGTLLLAFYVMETEVDKLGYPVGRGGRLWVGCAGLLCAGVAIYHVMRPGRPYGGL
jgi:hypothetical protein